MPQCHNILHIRVQPIYILHFNLHHTDVRTIRHNSLISSLNNKLSNSSTSLVSNTLSKSTINTTDGIIKRSVFMEENGGSEKF